MNSLESRYADGIAKSGGVWREQDSCLQQSGNRFAVDPRTNRLACATCNERPCWTGFHVSQSARPAFVPFYRIRTARKGRCAEQQVLPSPTVQPAHASSYFGECAYRDGASSQSCLARPEGPGATAFEEIRERPLMAESSQSRFQFARRKPVIQRSPERKIWTARPTAGHGRQPRFAMRAETRRWEIADRRGSAFRHLRGRTGPGHNQRSSSRHCGHWIGSFTLTPAIQPT